MFGLLPITFVVFIAHGFVERRLTRPNGSHRLIVDPRNHDDSP